MKLFPIDDLRKWDKATIDNQYESSAALMEVAAKACSEVLVEKAFAPFYIFVCGTGNNGGDGLVMARLLTEQELSVVVYVVGDPASGSDDFRENLQFSIDGDLPLKFLSEAEHELALPAGAIIVDAILGSGLSRPISGWLSSVVDQINKSDCKVVAIDIPSGLQSDMMQPQQGSIIEADLTLTIEIPKRSMLVPEHHRFVGDMIIVPIGLDGRFHFETPCDRFFYDDMSALQDLRLRGKFDHKGLLGHVLIVSGSKGMMGAAMLSAYAALRSGAGKVTAHIPGCGLSLLQTTVPEAMAQVDAEQDFCSEVFLSDKYSALCIGPGLGLNERTAEALDALLRNASVPCILDADALNIIAQKGWLSRLKKGTVITPHDGEFDRLFGKHQSRYERMETARNRSGELNIIIVLKGAYTITAMPEGELYFNASGNPGMATPGSGDVLCGMIGALLAQGYAPKVAARLGVFLHGVAGDSACESRGIEAMIARDMIEFIGDAYARIHHLNGTIH